MSQRLDDVDVVVNLISDADQADIVLPLAARLAARLGKPVINAPGRDQRTTRDAVAVCYRDIPGCRIPQILRLNAGTEVSAAALAKLLPFAFPCWRGRRAPMAATISRRSQAPTSSREFPRAASGRDHYVIEYVDYASADGHFRKYRFIFVGERILPYHLAIGNDWKVHHDLHRHGQPALDAAGGSGVSRQSRQPCSMPRIIGRCDAVRERIGLDYFGIDCGARSATAISSSSRSMPRCWSTTTTRNSPTRLPFVRAIKAAFDAMLRDCAGRARLA